MSIETIDPTLCPLCGGINACVLASGDGDADVRRCWCFHEYIPAGALERVPAAARDMACICDTCLRQLRKHPDALILEATPLRLAKLRILLKQQS
ncbi:DNA or RNA helicase of superfamily II [Pseudolysobacter antarcticus]|uniref:DNA or RNA helicase of superfamily II n=1 Tax=Pseudolysobacter antarcticus TaxID=2511995 RepID=A0A411HN56_9GAMM|nr:cysteine-rich CWC family protein [Pseudolysobacter antarcticus]QBB71896.1 DNA or RNA helicase of superfamily II [Pseudolysobacter antarcticus]